MPLPALAVSKIVALAAFHDVQKFDCGEPVRNSWLRHRALSNQRSDDTRTYVAAEGAHVSGFYALTVGSIIRGSLPGPLRRNAPDPVSCVLLAQLAVDLSCQLQALGRRLVLDAMVRAVQIAELAGCRLFAVHPAREDLVGYYTRFGFETVQVSPSLMAMSLQRVRATLEAVQAAAAGRAPG